MVFVKKLTSIVLLILTVFILSACDPTTDQASLNTNITQYVPVEHIELILSQQEACVGDQITVTVNITPANATNQAFTLSLSTNTMVNFSGTNQLVLSVIDDDPSGEIGETIVTVTSSDNTSVTDTQGVYVHPTGASACPSS